MLFFHGNLFKFTVLSAERSYTPSHHSYYSPKHDGMLEDTLASHQVCALHHTVLYGVCMQ